MKAPTVKKVPLTFELHGDVRHDDYYWLNQKENPEVIQYLEAENQYYAHSMLPHEALTKAIHEDMIARIPEAEQDVPVQRGPYFYYSREEKALDYPIYARKLASDRSKLEEAIEEITLDVNQLAKDADYIHIGGLRISPDHRLLSYLDNRDGTDISTLYIKNLSTGKVIDHIPDVYTYGGTAWSSDGTYLFYIKSDEMQRPYQLWRHQLGNAEDTLLYEEADATFNLYLEKSQSGRFLFVASFATNTTEIRIIDAENPQQPLRLFETRRTGVELQIEHWHNKFLILTNDQALNFKLMSCPLDDFTKQEAVIPYNESYFLTGMYPFKNALYVEGRHNGLQQIWKLENGELHQMKWDDPIYSVGLESGQDYETEEILVSYQSLTKPESTIRVDLATGQKDTLKETQVAGDYRPDDYVQEQVWATAPDGVKVPVLLQYKKGISMPAPVILKAYGSYGANSDPYFSPYRLPILERGVVMAIAQVRGGSELGRSWYYDGRMKKKRNTFTDFIAAADYLVATGVTTYGQLAGLGGSAGGLLIGAVANMAGHKFKVLAPQVPFVDVLTTMLDETIPLTTGEWDEWGNPKIAADYEYMRTYSPYDNVEAKPYPHMYVTTGLNDPRVGYWEPAKWVARLRELKTDSHTLVLKTNMGAGHFGESGRFNELREQAELYGFILGKIL